MKTRPAEIENSSMAIITAELRARGIALPPENAAVILRCIHASADFDYAGNLRFTSGAVEAGVKALRRGAEIVTDTNMTLAGLSRPGLKKLGGAAYCFMADECVAEAARARGTTRAVAAVNWAAAQHPGAILAVGNAPTALLRIAEKIEGGLRPALVIGVPVGFVNVVESKERVLESCEFSPREVLDELCERLSAEPIQVIGTKFVIFRRNHADPKIELVKSKKK